MPIKAHSKRPAYMIESVDSVLRLLRRFGDSSHLRISEAAEHLGVAHSTAHRLLAMLIYHGFAVQDERSREYRPGPMLHELAMAVNRDMDLRQHARPILEALRDELNESVNLAIPYGSQVLYIDYAESKQILKVGSRVGAFVPAHCISVGKVLLATLSSDQFRALYPTSDLPILTNRSVRTRVRLERELEEIRRRGYARSFEESEGGVCSIAVAVCDHGGQARAGISVAVPLSRHNLSREADWVVAAKRAASDIQARLWGSKDLPTRKRRKKLANGSSNKLRPRLQSHGGSRMET